MRRLGATGWASILLVACAPTESMPEPESISVEPVRTEAAPLAAAPAPELVSTCDPRAVAAARTAIATAIAKGVDAAMLADCDAEQIACATERAPLEHGTSCRMVAYASDARWEISIIPRPATGAPTQIEIWTDETGSEAGRVEISGCTFGVLEGVIVEGRGEYASHTHGGPPAQIGGASFVVENHRDRSIELKLTGTRWLTAHSCELPRAEQARPKPAGLALEDELIDGEMTVMIPAATTRTVSIGHHVQAAYMAYCDRFATAALFELDDEKLEVIAEHSVIRREPLRRP